MSGHRDLTVTVQGCAFCPRDWQQYFVLFTGEFLTGHTDSSKEYIMRYSYKTSGLGRSGLKRSVNEKSGNERSIKLEFGGGWTRVSAYVTSLA
jgi:hypothetical protein